MGLPAKQTLTADTPNSFSNSDVLKFWVSDVPVMTAVMLILTVPALIRGKMARWQGITLLTIYAAFCVLQFVL